MSGKTVEREATRFILAGNSPAMRRILDWIDANAAADAPPVLLGERGVGKEAAARALHAAGPHCEGPFLVVHCGAFSEPLLEAELFGQEAGAFSAASVRRKGVFETAAGGTVYLDEIGLIPERLREAIFRVARKHEFVRAGGTNPVAADCRIVLANRTDTQPVRDLAARLHSPVLLIPPLRERRDDISALAHHFVRKFAHEFNLREAPRLSGAALQRLLRHDWPGNARELANVIEGAMLLHPVAVLEPEHFSLPHARDAAALPLRPLEEVEREEIERVLVAVRNNYSRAARVLGIDRSTLYNKLRRYGTLRHHNG